MIWGSEEPATPMSRDQAAEHRVIRYLCACVADWASVLATIAACRYHPSPESPTSPRCLRHARAALADREAR